MLAHFVRIVLREVLYLALQLPNTKLFSRVFALQSVDLGLELFLLWSEDFKLLLCALQIQLCVVQRSLQLLKLLLNSCTYSSTFLTSILVLLFELKTREVVNNLLGDFEVASDLSLEPFVLLLQSFNPLTNTRNLETLEVWIILEHTEEIFEILHLQKLSKLLSRRRDIAEVTSPLPLAV